MRLAGIYGPGRHHILDQVCAGAVAGPWSQRLNLIHRDDAVGAILASAAATNEVKDRIYNVADAVADGAAFTIAPTKADVVLWLADRLGLAVPQESGAANGRRPATPDRVICSSAIRREIGWQPQYPTFREGYDAFLSLRGPEPR
jgi:nucleoside-diphosphate-sugar epimerase